MTATTKTAAPALASTCCTRCGDAHELPACYRCDCDAHNECFGCGAEFCDACMGDRELCRSCRAKADDDLLDLAAQEQAAFFASYA